MTEKKGCVTEVYARVTGFFRPVETWNPGKKQEMKDRKHYEVKDRRPDKDKVLRPLLDRERKS